jgi:hypothetical protein
MLSAIVDEECERIHRTLKKITAERGRLDREEARALREAQRLALWRRYGHASLVQYLEMELGYTPRQAAERLRVANVVETLPVIAEKLGSGEMPYSSAREITRVATPETEPMWVEACKDKNCQQVAAMVAGHDRGDLPTDPPKPELIKKILRYEVSPATAALERQVKDILAKRLGERLDDDALIAYLFRLVIDGVGAVERKHAPHQIAITRCEDCGRAWQERGREVAELTEAEIETAECDAERIGRLDAETPERRTQDIPPRVRDQVLARDGYRCTVPWCNATEDLQVHHIKHRKDGGTHEMHNLTTVCGCHHHGHHDGYLEITGRAPNVTFKKTPRGYAHELRTLASPTKKTG